MINSYSRMEQFSIEFKSQAYYVPLEFTGLVNKQICSISGVKCAVFYHLFYATEKGYKEE